MWSTIIEVLFALFGVLIKNKAKTEELKKKFLEFINYEERQNDSSKLNQEYKKLLKDSKDGDKKDHA